MSQQALGCREEHRSRTSPVFEKEKFEKPTFLLEKDMALKGNCDTDQRLPKPLSIPALLCPSLRLCLLMREA